MDDFAYADLQRRALAGSLLGKGFRSLSVHLADVAKAALAARPMRFLF